MKKTMKIMAFSCLMTGFLFTPVMAKTVTEPGGEGETTLETSKSASYTVIIPESATIPYGSTVSNIGSIWYTKGNLEPGASVNVSLKTKGDLANTKANNYTIPYKITLNGTEFTNVVYPEDAQQIETPLKAEITTQDWEAAKSGDYKARLVFNISYQTE